MIFQRHSPKVVEENEELDVSNQSHPDVQDEVETVVGPSVNVEGDFASEGNIIVKTSGGDIKTGLAIQIAKAYTP